MYNEGGPWPRVNMTDVSPGTAATAWGSTGLGAGAGLAGGGGGGEG